MKPKDKKKVVGILELSIDEEEVLLGPLSRVDSPLAELFKSISMPELKTAADGKKEVRIQDG